MANIITQIANFSLKAYLETKFKKADRPLWSAFIALFSCLNLIFLFHGAQYLFGDHDWSYLKNGIPLTAGLFEGRFSQFLFINLFTQGEILPILNNALGFLGYSLGIALLARYWQLPHTKQSYILFALFAGITPYILSFMYFAFLIIPVLSWNAFIIGALLISETPKTFSFKHSFLAILLFTLALGGYPPVINLLGVALVVRLLMHYISPKPTHTIKQILIFPLVNFLIAGIVYKLCLLWLTHTGAINSSYYNLQTTPLNQWGSKFILVIKDYFKQFFITLPFISITYKIATFTITVLAFVALITRQTKKVPTSKRLLQIGLYFAIPLAGLATLFLSTSLRETEFSPRIDFFGLCYAYAAMFAICLCSSNKLIKNFAILTAIFSIFYNAHTLLEAQKVWKLGFESEALLYKRILKRYETHPLFTPYNKYIMVQAGSPSFREKYYHNTYARGSDDLLSISYTPGLNSGVMWNYQSPTEYADKTAYVYTFRPDAPAIEAIQKAKPYPAAESIAVGGYWILTVLTPQALEELKNTYHIN